jgi:hypothetical protein
MKNTPQIVGIRRAAQFSPNHTGTDSAIFSSTVNHLENKGYRVRQITEEEFFHEEHTGESIIFSMVRNYPNVLKLQHLEKAGKTIINSGYGLEQCFRANLTRCLLENKLPHPQSVIVPTTTDDFSFLKLFPTPNVWIKRGDFHTMHKEDVSFCNSENHCREILREYALRGIPLAVISEHLAGDLVKFYAVEGTPFFFWFYPIDEDHIKFETASMQEKTNHYKFNEKDLERLARRSAEVLNIKIYGGDAIISSEGTIRLIDVNDWPSFAPCREKAAPYIAECIINSAK